MMAGLGIDFGPPEDQQYRHPTAMVPYPPLTRPKLSQTTSAPPAQASSSSSSRRQLPHGLPQRSAAPSLTHTSTALPPPRSRRVRIASGQPNVMGGRLPFAHQQIDDEVHHDASSPEDGYTSRSSFSGAVVRTRTEYSMGHLSSSSSSHPFMNDSPDHDRGAHNQQARLLRKRASQPSLTNRRCQDSAVSMGMSSLENTARVPERSTVSAGSADTLALHRKTKSVDAGTLRRREDTEELSQAASLSAPSSPPSSPRQRPALCGSASPSKVVIPLLTPEMPSTPRDDGMVPDGFGGYKPANGSISKPDVSAPSQALQEEVRAAPQRQEVVQQLPTSQSRKALPLVPMPAAGLVTAPLQIRPRSDRTQTAPPAMSEELKFTGPSSSLTTLRSQSFDGQAAYQGPVDTRSSFAIGEVIAPTNVYVSNGGALRSSEDAPPEHHWPSQCNNERSRATIPEVVSYERPSQLDYESRPAEYISSHDYDYGAHDEASVHSPSRSNKLDRVLNEGSSSPTAGQTKSPSRAIDVETETVERAEQEKPRVAIDVLLESNLVVEGGSLRGRLEVNIDKSQGVEENVLIAYPKVRVVGFEELLSDETRHIFYHHSTIADGDTQPGASQSYVLHGSPCLSSPGTEGREPLACFASQPDEEGYFIGPEGSHSIPFSLEIPIGKGAKGSYRGKKALVRYIVIGSIKVKSLSGSHRSIAHFYRHVDLLPYLNPAVVLASAPRPIQMSAERRVGGQGIIEMTASIHRPTWVAGQRVHINVAIRNGSSAMVKSVTLSLVRIVNVYSMVRRDDDAEASFTPDACEPVSSYKRVAEEILGIVPEGDVSSKTWWAGVPPHGHIELAHQLMIPAEALSIARSRHVEVSYVVRVSVGSQSPCDLTVDLPLRVVSFASLDPPPLKGISSKMCGGGGLARSWVAGSSSPRGGFLSDETPMIQKVRAAEALRSPAPIEIGRDQSQLPSAPSKNLSVLSQRAAQRNGHSQPNALLQAPGANPTRSIQHQKSLDFINDAIRSATARRSSSQQSKGEMAAMGLGIDIDAANSLQRRDLDEDRTPTSAASSTFSSSQASYATATSGARRRSSGTQHYVNIDVPAPSFGFPFLQLPVVSVDESEAFDSLEEEDEANRTLGLNQDSVDEVDMVVESTHRQEHEDRFNADEEESIDADMSTETVREDEEISLARLRKNTPVEDRSTEALAQSGCPSIKVESPESSSAVQHQAESVGRRVLHPTLATLPLSASTSRLTKPPGNLRARVTVPPALEKKAGVVVPEPPVKILPSGRDCSSPTKNVLKTKTSFTFATSEAPLRQGGKAPRPISALVRDAPRAKAAAAQFADAVGDEKKTATPNSSPTRARPVSKHPAGVAVSAPSPTKSSARPSPRKNVPLGRELSCSSDSDNPQEALTPDLGYDGEVSAVDEYLLKQHQCTYQAKVHASGGAVASLATPPRVRNESLHTSPATPRRTVRHSTSMGSIGEKSMMQRDPASPDVHAAATAASATAVVVVPSVRNKIAQLEIRQQALRQFVAPASSIVADDRTPFTTNRRDSASLRPLAASESRTSGSGLVKVRSRGSQPSLHCAFLAGGTGGPHVNSSSNGDVGSAATRLTKKVSALSLLQSEVDWEGNDDNGRTIRRRGSVDSMASFKAPVLRGLGI